MIASSVSMGDRGSLNRLEVREDLMRGIYNISRERKGTEEDNPEKETKIREPHSRERLRTRRDREGEEYVVEEM